MSARSPEFRQHRFAQPPLLVARWCGRKSGIRFCDYSGPELGENPRLAL